MASYIRLLAFTIASSLAYPLAANAQNSSDLRSLTIPAIACEITYTEFTGNAGGGRHGNSVIYAEASGGGTAVVQAFCPVQLSNIRVSGSGSPRLVKFRVHYMDSDAAGTAVRVIATLMKTYITAGGSIPGDGVGCLMDLSTIGNTSGVPTTSTAICSAPYTFQAKAFYNMIVTLSASSGQTAQFIGIDFP